VTLPGATSCKAQTCWQWKCTKDFTDELQRTDAQRWWIATGRGRSVRWVPADESGAAAGAVPFVIEFAGGLPIHDYLHLSTRLWNANSWIATREVRVRRRALRVSIPSAASLWEDNLDLLRWTLVFTRCKYTRIATPDVTTAFTGNADTGWATIGHAELSGRPARACSESLTRHRFTLQPVTASGIRLIVAGHWHRRWHMHRRVGSESTRQRWGVAFARQLVLTTTLNASFSVYAFRRAMVELYNRGTTRLI